MTEAPSTPEQDRNEHRKEHFLELVFVLIMLMVIGAWIWADKYKSTNTENVSVKTLSNAVNKNARLLFITKGLTNPTAMAYIPGDNRIYATEQNGVVRVIESEKLLDTPLLDIQADVKAGGEMGLLGLAFDPHFKDNHYFYLNYNDVNDKSTIVARFTAEAKGLTADIKTRKIILRQAQPFDNHKGGQIVFGPDGYLYITFGDGGSGGDPQANGQNLGTWLGKILRIDVNKGDPYSVPPNNPFVSSAGAKPEIWDFGLRNPWRMSFDGETKNLLIADVGQGKIEEIDLETAGKGGNNYGWRCYEGDQPYNVDGCTAKNLINPYIQYSHTDSPKRCSVTGGYVYRGSKAANLRGRYFYSDYCSGEIWSVNVGTAKPTPRLDIDSHLQISTFGEDNKHELYLADYPSGTIYRLITVE